MSYSSLQEWLLTTLRTLVPENGEDGVIHRLEVWHHSDEEHQRIRVFRLEDRDEQVSEMPLLLASELEKVCAQHSSTMPAGNSLRYAIQAYRGRDDNAPEACHYVVMTGTLLPNPGNSAASERGQLIRHNETLHNMMMGMVQSFSGRLAKDLEEERNARQAAERRYSEVIMLREEMLDRKHERELEAAREARDAAQKESLIAMGASLLPALISRMGSPAQLPGGKEAPEAVIARDQAVAKLIDGLTAEEIQGVASSLRPEKQAALLTLIDAHLSKGPPPPPPSKGAAPQSPERRN